jgi:hypothetical protein
VKMYHDSAQIESRRHIVLSGVLPFGKGSVRREQVPLPWGASLKERPEPKSLNHPFGTIQSEPAHVPTEKAW